MNIGGLDIGVTSVRFFRVMFTRGVGGRDATTCGQLYVLNSYSVPREVVLFGLDGGLAFTTDPFRGQFGFFTVTLQVTDGSNVGQLFYHDECGPRVSGRDDIVGSTFEAWSDGSSLKGSPFVDDFSYERVFRFTPPGF